jgi:hypothetical protein
MSTAYSKLLPGYWNILTWRCIVLIYGCPAEYRCRKNCTFIAQLAVDFDCRVEQHIAPTANFKTNVDGEGKTQTYKMRRLEHAQVEGAQWKNARGDRRRQQRILILNWLLKCKQATINIWICLCTYRCSWRTRKQQGVTEHARDIGEC